MLVYSTCTSMPNSSMCASRAPTLATSRVSMVVVICLPTFCDRSTSASSVNANRNSPRIFPSMTQFCRCVPSLGSNRAGRYFCSEGVR